MILKLFMLIFLVNQASADGVNPMMTINDLYYVDRLLNFNFETGQVIADGPLQTGIPKLEYPFNPVGRGTTLNLEQFFYHLRLSSSVFPCTNKENTGSGTCFYIGNNHVLSNRHVITDKDPKDSSCGEVKVFVSYPVKKEIACERVEFCHEDYDFCLVRLKPDEILTHIPALKLSNKSENSSKPLLAIGNALNYGIQASVGKDGISEKESVSGFSGAKIKTLHHYAPTYPGSSGSPLFLEGSEEVVGINYAGKVVTSEGGNPILYEWIELNNFAAPSYIIINELKKEGFDLSTFTGGNLPRREITFLKNELQKFFSFANEDLEFQKHFFKNYFQNIKELSDTILPPVSTNQNFLQLLDSIYKFSNLTPIEKAWMIQLTTAERGLKVNTYINKIHKKVFEYKRAKGLIDSSDLPHLMERCIYKKQFSDSCWYREKYTIKINEILSEIKLDQNDSNFLIDKILSLYTSSSQDYFVNSTNDDILLLSYKMKIGKAVINRMSQMISIEGVLLACMLSSDVIKKDHFEFQSPAFYNCLPGLKLVFNELGIELSFDSFLKKMFTQVDPKSLLDGMSDVFFREAFKYFTLELKPKDLTNKKIAKKMLKYFPQAMAPELNVAPIFVKLYLNKLRGMN